jgi:aspartate kinase
VTGFIGADASGRTTTLGRGGSDYSAAIFASALDASVLERWTDVDGIYTNDPAVDRKAKRLERLEAELASSLNQVGKIGMHRDALEPVTRSGIPVHVRSTFAPDREGTWILPSVEKQRGRQAAR